MAKKEDKNFKEYGLKQSETNLLRFIQQKHAEVFSGALSTIAADRLAYKVTPDTQFKISRDYSSVQISEREPEKKEDKKVAKESK